MKNSKLRKLILTSMFIIISSFIIPHLPSYSEEPPPPPVLTIDSYLNLSQAILQMNIDNLNTLIVLVQSLSKEEFIQKEYQYSENLKKNINDLYLYYNTTEAEYVSFNSKNKSNIEWYLIENSAIDQKIKDLSTQFDNLIDQYENLLVSKGIRG